MSFTEFYCNHATGSNLNAGSTESGTAAHTYASGTWVQSTRVFTVASGDPAADGVAVGDFASVYPDAATVSPYVGRVSAVSATTITIDTTAISGTAPVDGTTNTTIKIGGAWKGPNAAEGFPFGFITGALMNTSSFRPRVNLKSGTNYSITATLTVAVGQYVTFQGYTTTVGDFGKAVIDGGTAGASYVLLSTTVVAASNMIFTDLIFQNNGATGSEAGISQLSSAVEPIFSRIVVNNVRGWGAIFTASAIVSDLLAHNCNQSNTAGFGGVRLDSGFGHRIIARDNNGHGIRYGSTTGAGLLVNCISTRNTTDGFIQGSHRVFVCLTNCISYDNGGVGISEGGSGAQTINVLIENCIVAYNGGRGIDLSATSPSINAFLLKNNAVIGNTGDNFRGASGGTNTSAVINENMITLTVDPFVNAAGDDFNLNDTAGGGAELRAVTVVLP